MAKKSGPKSQGIMASISSMLSGGSTKQPAKSSFSPSALCQVLPKLDGMIELSVGDIRGIGGRFRIKELGMGEVDTEIVLNFIPNGAPYLIAVKRDQPPMPWGMYWGGEGFVIDTAAILAQYWPDTMELGCMSPEDAWATLQWLKEKQDVWRDQVLSHNGHEPKRPGSGRTAQ